MQQENLNSRSSPSVVKVVISAYYRSGSTLVSDILTLRNDTFYLCEPFYGIYAHWYGSVGNHEVFHASGGKRRLDSVKILKVYNIPLHRSILSLYVHNF